RRGRHRRPSHRQLIHRLHPEIHNARLRLGRWWWLREHHELPAASPGGGVRVLLRALRAGAPVPQAARVLGFGNGCLRWREARCHVDESVSATVNGVAHHVGRRLRSMLHGTDVAVPYGGVVAAWGSVAARPADTVPDTGDLPRTVLVELGRWAPRVHAFLAEACRATGASRGFELQWGAVGDGSVCV